MRIACVLKTGGVYRAEHVYALRDMCQQWMPEHHFVCLTDLPDLDCETKPLQQNLAGWWSKLELFDAFTSGETLYMDLDTVVRGPCVDLLKKLENKKFVILRDFGRAFRFPKSMGSGLMFWRDDYRWIFELFMAKRPENSMRGDQDFLKHAFNHSGKPVEYWQDFTSDICSFKMHIRDQNPASSASLVCFHGSPRPWAQSLISYPDTMSTRPAESHSGSEQSPRFA